MTFPLLVLDPVDALPPYEQIHVQIRRQIAAGHLPPGSALPSVRQLARDLRVAPNTVVRAYAELEAGGWVVARPRCGVVVADGAPRLTPGERARQLAEAVTELLVATFQLGAEPDELHAEIDRQLMA